MKNSRTATVTQLHEFDEIIDVRTPAEFAEDHVPGAINCPVLSNEERVIVGTLYKQESAFAAKKVGAALIARRIAEHLELEFANKPREWRPLIYCWRGGNRSGAMTHILNQVGWRASILDGGYKSYRRHVREELAELPIKFKYQVVSGSTGSGKSRLLEALASQGAQVLDLESLASHKGSVLGGLPDMPQPSQKMFDTVLAERLQQLDPNQVVFIEAESRKIGSVQVPDALLDLIRTSPCLKIQATIQERVKFLLEDYVYFLQDPESLKNKLTFLRELQSSETLTYWDSLIDQGAWEILVAELLEKHYDALYSRSQDKNYERFKDAPTYLADDLSPKGLKKLAIEILSKIPPLEL